MVRIAYFDCFSGIAGDMALGALIDAGASQSVLIKHLSTLELLKEEWTLETQKVVKGKGSIAALKATVHSKYLHQPLPPPTPEEHDHGHHHHHHQSHEDHTHDQPIRNLEIISNLISESTLPQEVKATSIKAFALLAAAEAETHGTTIDQIHFHEVGAIDSIIDTVGTILALHLLDVKEVYASALPLGQGIVNTAHGKLPVPAPATARLMRGIPTVQAPGNVMGELVTPTGVSILKATCKSFGPPPEFTVEEIGIGAGTKDFPQHPNILRVFIGEKQEQAPIRGKSVPDWTEEKVMLLEANIDDMNPEIAGYVKQLVLKEKALDVWSTPIHMKKDRPAYKLSVLCQEEDMVNLAELIFRETSTLGLRTQEIDRICLKRTEVAVETAWGVCRVKMASYQGKVINSHPEYEDCKKLAEASNVPIHVVMSAAKTQVPVVKE